MLTDPDAIQPFAHDWTNRWTGHPLAVVRPSTTEEVSAVMRSVRHAGTPVVVQGGNTGLVAGSVAPTGFSSAEYQSARRYRTDRSQCSTSDSRSRGDDREPATACTRGGLDYGVDLGSRDSATIGGTVATNAGGIRVVCRGDTRSQVLGVEAVLADGSVTSHLGGSTQGFGRL